MEEYKVVKKIGVGTYGSAYLVSSKKDQAQFVLKKIKIDEDNEKEKQQAELEVTVLSSLNHPLILGYVDHFMYKGHLCLVTDYCEAGDLYSLLRARKTPLPEAQILEWLVQVVLAIQYVHAKNILHRDLKTQNIFLTKDSTVKLGDFGISRPLNGSLDLASTIIGTPYYMSPEVMSSQPYDFKSDMWSLGCCLYEMMSLKHAFDASDMSSLVCKIMRGEHLPIPQQFSPDIRDLTKALLSRSPAKRPTPEAILKLPWLKEYTARARDKVARMELQTSPSRRRRPSVSTGLDRELEVAKQRLAHIQNQREALAALKGAAAARMVAGRQPSGNGAALPVVGAGGPGPVSGSNGSDGGARPPLPPGARQGNGVPTGSGETGATRRLSRNSSFGELDEGSGRASMDPKARREAKRQEEIRQREAELLNARRAYYEERKQAEAKQWHMIHGETHHTSGRRMTGSDGMLMGGAAGELQRMQLSGESDDMREGAQRKANNPAQPVRQGSTGEAAAEDFEAELQLLNQGLPSSHQPLFQTLGGGGVTGAGERAGALRELCGAALGPQLLDLLYGVMRQRATQGGDDSYFRQEVLSRLGPHRMQYLQLLDALIYYEDIASG